MFNAILMAYNSAVKIEASQGNDAVFIPLSVTTAEPIPRLLFEPSYIHGVALYFSYCSKEIYLYQHSLLPMADLCLGYY